MYGHTRAHAANGACKAFLMSLRITYSDGTVRTIDSSATDGKWEWSQMYSVTGEFLFT